MRNQNYSSFKEIEYDLKRLNLERQIAVEQLKSFKVQVQEDLQPLNWVQSGFKLAGKLSTVVLLKKLFK